MCCFSGPVTSVTNTQIFARAVEGGRQVLAYAMHLSAAKDLAMILPLPVPAGAAEDAVRFIDLKGYKDFFEDLQKGFPEPLLRAFPTAKAETAPAAPPTPLAVVEVGDFEASFVPTVKDFSRLDARFRLPEQTWDALPVYKSYGFAVFKLKKGVSRPHPMAFDFPRADATKIFFPTVHIHDGKVHDEATFDHVLYCQKREGDRLSLPDWRESDVPASRFMKVEQAQGLVVGPAHCYQKKIVGKRKNEDILI